MKRSLLLVAAVLTATAVLSQESGPLRIHRPGSLRDRRFSLPDSLACLALREIGPCASPCWSPQPRPALRSLVVVAPVELPRRITVLDDNSLRLSPRFLIGNGQASNWGPYLDSYLDARTLSFPMPR